MIYIHQVDLLRITGGFRCIPFAEQCFDRIEVIVDVMPHLTNAFVVLNEMCIMFLLDGDLSLKIIILDFKRCGMCCCLERDEQPNISQQ